MTSQQRAYLVERARKRKSRRYPAQSRIEAAGREMKANPPAILARTEAKFGAERARRQRIAIMLSKARREKG